MATVTFPVEFGGNGMTVTDDASPSTGLDGVGYTVRFVPALKQSVAMVGHAVNRASAAQQSAAAAFASAAQASADRAAVAADREETIRQRQRAETAAGDAQAAKMGAMDAAQEVRQNRNDVAVDRAVVADARDETLAAASVAQQSERAADEHRVRAETARDDVLANSEIFDDVAAGMSSGLRFFAVPTQGDMEFLALYRNSAGAAELVGVYPSQKMLVYGVEFGAANRLITMFMQLEIRMDRLAINYSITV